MTWNSLCSYLNVVHLQSHGRAARATDLHLSLPKSVVEVTVRAAVGALHALCCARLDLLDITRLDGKQYGPEMSISGTPTAR